MNAHLVLADQQVLFRQSLAQTLADAGWLHITQVGDRTALDLIFLEAPATILIIDRFLPEVDITIYCRLLIRQQPYLRILVLTAYEPEARDLQLTTLLAGAAGCLSKEHAASIYLSAVQVLMQGQVLYQHATINDALRPSEALVLPTTTVHTMPLLLHNQLADLTPREVEILQLVAKGMGNPEIAGLLNITDNTVMKHVSHIISKLGVRNRMEAALVYLRSV